jgi:flagellar M-ring protein FliF
MVKPNAGGSAGLVGRARDLATRLTPLQKVGLGAVVLTVVVGALVLGRGSSGPSMSPLYTDLQSKDASAVVDSLSSRGVHYSLTDAGHTVLVPTDQVYDLRVAMAGAGIPSSSEGYSLLDKQGITTSDFRQRIDYQRALEGELDKTLEAMQGIQSAAVHLALPEESVFIDTPAKPTASVLLVGTSPDGINPDAVGAVVNLVASSVKNLQPADVTVIDSNGAVLSASGVSTGTSGSWNRAVTTFEQQMSRELTALLTRATGAGKVAVSVTAALDLDQVQSTKDDYGPIGDDDTGAYVVSEQTASESYAGGGGENATAGVLGPDPAVDGATVASGIDTATTAVPTTIDPAAPTTTAAADATTTTSALDAGAATSTTAVAAATTSVYGSSTATRTYAVDHVVEQVTKAPGTIERLHVAVLLDSTAVSEEQVGTIEDLVSTAAGIDPARGDSLTVSRLPFDTSAAQQAAALSAENDQAAAKAKKEQLIRTLAIAGVILIAVLLAYRSARRARRVTATPINIGEISLAPRSAAAELPGPDASGPEPADPQNEAMLEIAAIAERRPEDVANVLRTWLAEAESR